MFHDNDNRRFVVLDREDLDAICDALSVLSFALTREIPSERLRSAAMVEGIVQEISAKYDLPGEPTR